MKGQASGTTCNSEMTEFKFRCVGDGTCYEISEGGKVLEIHTTIIQGPGAEVFISPEKQ